MIGKLTKHPSSLRTSNELVDVYTRTEDTGMEYHIRPMEWGYLAWVCDWGKVEAEMSFPEEQYGSDAATYAAIQEWFTKIGKLAQGE